jgi:hypothetical protein
MLSITPAVVAFQPELHLIEAGLRCRREPFDPRVLLREFGAGIEEAPDYRNVVLARGLDTE